MYAIDMTEPTEDFRKLYAAAGSHLQRTAGGDLNNWLKADCVPPFLEHISFRLGNQLFFVRVECAGMDVPGTRSGLEAVASGCRGYPCIMEMKRTGRGWEAAAPGWGLTNLRSGELIDPIQLITDELIEITDWELQDFAVQIVRNSLRKDGRQIMSAHSNPDVDPSIWFVGSNGPEWVVVRAVRFPIREAQVPPTWRAIAIDCSRMSLVGNFASVAVAAQETRDDNAHHPLFRGHGYIARYLGLRRPTDAEIDLESRL